MTAYGADPTGKTDSTDAILKAISDAVSGDGDGFLMEGIKNLGGVRINLEGGIYKISRPIKLPVAGRGNMLVSFFFLLILSKTMFYFLHFKLMA